MGELFESSVLLWLRQ